MNSKISQAIYWLRNAAFCSPFLLLLFYAPASTAQRDSAQLAQLVSEVNGRLIYPTAQGMLMRPDFFYPYNHEHVVRDITMVDGMTVQRLSFPRQDSFFYSVKNNQTVVLEAENQRDSKTYFYHEDGRLERILKGGHVEDLLLYDEERALIQRGTGVELLRANKVGNTFEWLNVDQNQLDYVLAFDTLGQTTYFKKMGHLYGIGLAYELEEYNWNRDQLIGQQIIRSYKKGKADTTLIEYIYDEQGLLSMGRIKKSDDLSWSSVPYVTKVQFEQTGLVRISISHNNQTLLTVTFDEHDNWVEIVRPSITLRRQISYRKRRRRK